MSELLRLSVKAALPVLVVAACGSGPVATSPTATQSTASTTTATTATTTAIPSTLVTTTTTTTTMSPTTSPTTSLHALESSGWSELDRDSVSSKAFPPCCAETWHGDVSPPLTPAGEPLSDGPYAVVGRTPGGRTGRLVLEVFRFEQCARLPEGSCPPPPVDVGYAPTELGIDSSESRRLIVALDERVRVVVVGWEEGAGGVESLTVREGAGSDLAELTSEVDDAYAEVFADRFVAGEEPTAIVADVLENPTGGFSPSTASIDALVFTPENGPPLLFQSVFPYVDERRVAGTGSDVLAIRSIDVVGGRVTVYVFAGYYP